MISRMIMIALASNMLGGCAAALEMLPVDTDAKRDARHAEYAAHEARIAAMWAGSAARWMSECTADPDWAYEACVMLSDSMRGFTPSSTYTLPGPADFVFPTHPGIETSILYVR